MTTRTGKDRLRSLTRRIARNPHFWIVLVLSAILLFIYQAWPWREWQFTDGFWRFFSWLSKLDCLVLHVELRFQVFGVLFFIPIIYGSLALSWAGGLFAWLLSLIWVLPKLLIWDSTTVAINITLLLLPVLVVAVVYGERRWRESERRSFAERQQEQQAYFAKLVETQEAERARIAQELHDETLQRLMVIANRADSLAASTTDDRQITGNQWIKQEVLRTMSDLRRLSMNLRPSILDSFGLVSGLRWLVNNCNSQSNCHLNIIIEGEEREMCDLAEVTIFRVAQEAIYNIQRHSQATKGRVALEFGEDLITLEIVDNGIGFQPPERLALLVRESKLGIIGIEQRVLSTGGTLYLESAPGKGTKLRVAIPYSFSADIL